MAVEIPTLLIREKFAKLKFSEYVSVDESSTPSTPLTPDTPLLPPPEPYSIRIIRKDETEKVLDFLRRFFFRDEPLNVDIKLLDGDRICSDLEEFSTKPIKDNLSLMAITDSGKIIGISLNGLIQKEVEEEEEESEMTDPKFSKIYNLLMHVDREVDIFRRYPDVDKMVMVEILSVDGSWRGQGIAKKLMNKTRDLARDQGVQLMRVDCTSHFSAKAIARLGFECIYKLKYEDYLENGAPVFNPEPPHKQVTVYIQKINE